MIPVREEDRDKTAFATSSNVYGWKHMPFNLSTAPATFHRLMQSALDGVLVKFAWIYLDDVLVFSVNFKDHIKHTDNTLALVANAGVTLGLEKCAFAQQNVRYLGHIVSGQGIAVNLDKLVVVDSFATPHNVMSIRCFMGMVGCIRHFIPGFAQLSVELTEIKKKKRNLSGKIAIIWLLKP